MASPRSKRSRTSYEAYDDEADDDGSFKHSDDEDSEEEEILQPLSQTDNYAPPEPVHQRRRKTDLFGGDCGGGGGDDDGWGDDDGTGGIPNIIVKGKRIHDRCHGSITLEPLLVRIMDTREFQRLRGLKQLGGSVFVYPDASHSRFEHSIGVAHLAAVMVTRLRDTNPILGIDDRDVTCVSLAGLVHDLGHGPFSHMFELFVNDNRADGEGKFRHEDMSVNILKHLLERNHIMFEDYMDYATVDEANQDLEFVVKLIQGLKPAEPMPERVGRPESKRFLFEIVSNQRNGIDVDKLDYFHRDASSAFGEKDYRVQTDRIIESVRVDYDEEGKSCICYEEKNHLDILNIFKTRMHLHLTLYQHHVVNVIEKMIEDALAAAKDVKVVRGTPREGSRDDRYTLLEATTDVEAYVQLGDWILEYIEASPDEGFREAQRIIRRLRVRNLYRQAGDELVSRSQSLEKERVHAMIVEECARLVDGTSHVSSGGLLTSSSSSSSLSTAEAMTNEGCGNDHRVSSDLMHPVSQQGTSSEDGPSDEAEFATVGEDDIIVMEVCINHGKDPIDGKIGYPLKHVLFYNPKQPDTKPKIISENSFRAVQLPRSWGQLSFWVYVRAQDRAVNHTISKAWENVQQSLRKERKAQAVQSLQNQQSPAHRNSLSASGSSSSGRRVSRGSTGFGGGARNETLFDSSSMDPIVER